MDLSPLSSPATQMGQSALSYARHVCDVFKQRNSSLPQGWCNNALFEIQHLFGWVLNPNPNPNPNLNLNPNLNPNPNQPNP